MMPRMKSSLSLLLALPMASALADPPGYNYDEDKLPAYTLPPLLDAKTKSAADWPARRAEMLQLLEREEFGKAPPLPKNIKTEITLAAAPAFNGKAVRQQITVYFTEAGTGAAMDVLLYLPAKATGPVPIFWALNFTGNHTIEPDPAIPLCRSWLPDGKFTKDHRALPEGRGTAEANWQIEMALDAGFGVATACYHDLDPDFDDGFKNGVHAAYPDIEAHRDGGSWGTLAAYAWGLRLGISTFEKEPKIDSKRIVVFGHSRLGKATLWAGATDERIAIVISVQSGAGGAALHKRIFGETVERLNTSFPHWFDGNFKKYNGKESDLPFDQHFLLACIAPRPLLITSATEDRWADPNGEFLSAKFAAPAYELLGREGIGAQQQPPPDKLLDSRVGYLLRTGNHEVIRPEWEAFIAFAKKHLPPP